MPGLNYIPPSSIPDDTPYWLRAYGLSSSFSPTPTQPVTVNYALKTNGSTPGGDAYRALTSGEVANIETSLAAVARNSGLTFVESAPEVADVLIGATSDPSGSVYGRTWSSFNQPVQVVAYDAVYSTSSGLANNGYIYIHELMHAVGLKHSTRAFGSTLDYVIPDDEDNGTTLFGSWSSAWNGEIQLFDLAVMQFLYGPDTSKRAGDDVYTPIFNAFDPGSPNQNNPLLWDGAGQDTIDLSAAGGGAVASLAPGFISQVNTTNTGILDAGTFSINYGSQFETLIGTGYADTLYGHTGKERISGGGGNDRIEGDKGHDRLQGGNGKDTILGQAGKDKLFGGNWHDILKGGGGNDIIFGGNGNDRMSGGKGADMFVFNSGATTGSDRITDFQDGVDLLKFSGGARFADFSITPVGDDTRIDWDNGSVFLVGVSSGAITEADFILV